MSATNTDSSQQNNSNHDETIMFQPGKELRNLRLFVGRRPVSSSAADKVS